MDLTSSSNAFVRRLSREESERLGPSFERVPLQSKQTLHEQHQPIEHVYFVEAGVVSIVTALDGDELIETGTVGHEGLVGTSAILGSERSTYRAFCQIPGGALRIPAAVLARERENGTPWFRRLLLYVDFLTGMIAQTAACNRVHQVDARMSRWLLMTHDRVPGDEFPLTQEFLAQMLGVARPTVNITGATLQKAGFIRYTRGRITVVDRAGLETAACECYGRINALLEGTLGTHARIRAVQEPAPGTDPGAQVA